MIHAEDAGVRRSGRRRRSVSEKRQIVELTIEPGASVAQVARANGVNANQVFKWRRVFERGELVSQRIDGFAPGHHICSLQDAVEEARRAGTFEPSGGGHSYRVSRWGDDQRGERCRCARCCAAILESLRK